MIGMDKNSYKILVKKNVFKSNRIGRNHKIQF